MVPSLYYVFRNPENTKQNQDEINSIFDGNT